MKPKLAAFPKCYMDELCVHHTMTVFEWIELAATLEVDGLEFYWGFLEDDEPFLSKVKAALETPQSCHANALLLSRFYAARSPCFCKRRSSAKSG